MSYEHIEQACENIGIPRMQAKVYLDLVQFGASSVSKIAKRTKMHRANVYDVLGKLAQKNLVYTISKDGTTLYSSLSLDFLIREQKEKMDFAQKEISLFLSNSNKTQQPKVSVFEGAESIKNLLFRLLDYKQPILAYGFVEHLHGIDLVHDNLLKTFHSERIKQRIALKCLFSNYPVDEMRALNQIKLVEARVLPSKLGQLPVKLSEIVCGDNLYYVVWNKPVHIISIEHPFIAKEHIRFFQLLWEVSGSDLIS